MIELERHIEILLLSNDCVIVPGFGGFMAHHVDSRYDEQEHLFLPPQRTIGFNPQLTLNDSLLAQSYIEAYDISYPEAIRRISDEVRELKQHLENTGRYELYDLGTVILNEYGKYEFEPCEAGILSPELYGLSSFEMAPLTAADSTATSAETFTASQPGAPAMIHTVPDATPADDDSDDEPRIRVSTLRNIAVACMAIIAFFTISTPISTTNNGSLKAGINTDMLFQVMPNSSVSTPAGTPEPALTKDGATTIRQATLAAQTKEAAPVDTFYTVVLCSRVTVKNATRYVDQLTAEGVKGVQVLTRGRHTKVIMGRYTTEREAHAKAAEINRSGAVSGCWVTKVID